MLSKIPVDIDPFFVVSLTLSGSPASQEIYGQREFAAEAEPRPGRPVQITYDVEVGNAIELKELPFVMGVSET